MKAFKNEIIMHYCPNTYVLPVKVCVLPASKGAANLRF